MTTLTKLLSVDSTPAQSILEQATSLPLSTEQRLDWPEVVTVDGQRVTIAVEEKRPLYIGDVFLDAEGKFWVVRGVEEDVLLVTGDLQVMHEAVHALVAREVPLAGTEDGFMVLANDNLAKMLEMIGLTATPAREVFEPIRFVRGGCGCGGGGCGCGGHDHDHGEGCGCGGHGHEHGEGCGCGGHGHEHGEGCGCGSHGHEHGEGCGCGSHGHGHGHGHEHGEGCGCGSHGHEHGHRGGCGCGNH